MKYSLIIGLGIIFNTLHAMQEPISSPTSDERELEHFFLAIGNRDTYSADKMLQTNPSLGQMNDNQSHRTALHFAAACITPNFCKKLLTYMPATINDKKKETPLHYNIRFATGHIETTQLLLDKGADPLAKNEDGETPFHIASKNGALAKLKLLITHMQKTNKKIELKQLKDSKLRTPLHMCTFAPRMDEIEIFELLTPWFPIADYDNESNTLLHYAAQNHQVRIIEKIKGRFFNPQNTSGLTPLATFLQTKVASDDDDIYKLLTSENCNFKIKDGKKRSLLYHALSHGRTAFCIDLMNRELEVNSVDTEEMTPLHYYLAMNTNIQSDTLFNVLIKKGASVYPKDAHGNSPLHYAAQNNHHVIVEALIKAEVNLEVPNNNGKKPIQLTTSPLIKDILQKAMDTKMAKNVGRLGVGDEWQTV